MGTFTPSISKSFEFDGDSVTVVFNRMKNRHFLRIAPFLLPDPEGPRTLQAGMMRSVKLVEDSKDILKECIVSVSGLTDSSGRSLVLEDIIEEGFFIPLLDRMLGALMEVSVLREVDAKKSDAPQADITQEVEGTTMSLQELPLNGGIVHSMDVMT